MRETSEPKKEKKEFGKFDRWEVMGAVDTIIRAEQIKLDRELMKYVLPELEKQKQALDKASSAAEILYGKAAKEKEKSND